MRRVDEQVLIRGRLLQRLSVQVVSLSPQLLVVGIAVDDASPVLLLVFAGSGQLEEGKGCRDQGDAHPETGLYSRLSISKCAAGGEERVGEMRTPNFSSEEPGAACEWLSWWASWAQRRCCCLVYDRAACALRAALLRTACIVCVVVWANG